MGLQAQERQSVTVKLRAIILIVFLVLSETSARDSTELNTDARVMNDANLSSLTIKGENENTNAYFLKAGKHVCSLRIYNGMLEFAADKIPFLSANHVEVTTSKRTVFSKGVHIKNDMEIDGKRQWSLAYRMDYKDFDPSIIYECGIYKLIGGYKKTSLDDMTRSFIMPKHKMVKIEGHYHFLDNWKGETGYVKIVVNKKDQQVVWTESADIRGITNGIDTCGGATIDPIIGRKFDVTMLHDEPTLDLVFGSTLTCDPGYASYGISDLEIYIL